jgi:two-component system, cell cycle sensor histidine kinase and response regulator CckA
MAQDSLNNSKTILLAEDEAVFRELSRTIFERAGFSVIVAQDGLEALRIANEHPDAIDLLVSDVQMPGLTGPELATALRRTRPGLRVLLISAYPQRMLLLGNRWNFLQKPFHPQVIIDKVHEITSNPRSPRTQQRIILNRPPTDPCSKGWRHV